MILAALRDHLQRLREADRGIRLDTPDADAEVRDLLDSDRYFALLDGLEGLASHPPWSAEATKKARRLR